MPTTEYPPLSNWQDFESLAADLFTAIYGRSFHKWGRSGQRQKGLDVFGKDKLGQAIAVQCKLHGYGKKITNKDIDTTLEKLKKFEHQLDEIYILTTAHDDVGIQNYIQHINTDRRCGKLCVVHIWGWETISQKIALYPTIQRKYYSHWIKKTSMCSWIIISISIIIAVIFATHTVHSDWIKQDKFANQKQERGDNLRNITKSISKLQKIYEQCLMSLDATPFSFSRTITRHCVEPARDQMEIIHAEITNLTPQASLEAWGDVHNMEIVMDDDIRQGALAAQMTVFFEDEFIRDMKLRCHPKSLDDGLKKSLRESVENTAKIQLNYYFILRDFILPRLDSAEAIILAHARENNSQPIPSDLADRAKKFGELFDQQRHDQIPPYTYPLIIEATKKMSARTIHIGQSEVDAELEDLRINSVLLEATQKSFQGRPKDIEDLIACGVMKPNAMNLVKGG
ncbi:restriction endonuclease [Acetobacter conturbans]|uniref:Mrr-like domain-containing protein n=1 Tax=Acetobacter conturbans TaxID=1737472 RepID=A0ABX0K179_9PROT|nr:restriction endonuclease [Acetobacter conturbans]NHN89491.1 hypothetical protein [Acetobacter conturbans]